MPLISATVFPDTFANPADVDQDEGGGIADGGTGAKLGTRMVAIAALFAFTATAISLVSIWQHLKNYRKPILQRSVIRILWMVPIYAMTSLISLLSLDTAFYFDIIRDLYEAFVIYCFFTLLLQRLGGERALLIELHSRPPTQTFFPHTLFASNISLGDPYVFLFVKRGILQYALVKPVLAVVTMVLKWTGSYQDGQISFNGGYFWVALVYNFSVCLALWCLVVFFYATKDDLWDFRPLPKFLSIKAVIFFSFWQSVLVSLFVAVGLIRDTDNHTAANLAVAIQDFLICLEMAPAALAHLYAFSYRDYTVPTKHSARLPLSYAIRDSFGIKDVVIDIFDTLRGSRFNYRAFEPSEGIPKNPASRQSRIMAGLRYSSSGAAKRWVEGPRRTGYYGGAAVGIARREDNGELREAMYEEEDNTLEFDNVEEGGEIEIFYTASRDMLYGDYNYPVVDFKAPIQPTSIEHIRSYGSVSGGARSPIDAMWESRRSREGKGKGKGKGKDKDKGKGRHLWNEDGAGGEPSMVDSTTKYKQVRDGCVDLVVDEGKGQLRVNYKHEPSPQPGRASSTNQPKRTSRREVVAAEEEEEEEREDGSENDVDLQEGDNGEHAPRANISNPWDQNDWQGSTKSPLRGVSFFSRPVEADEEEIDGGVWRR